MANPQPETVGGVLLRLTRNPFTMLIRRWNWKSALLSSILRGLIFFGANLTAGLKAATAAMALEFVFAAAMAGFFGSLIQAFRRAHPAWLAFVTVMALVLAVAHTMEFALHSWQGTPNLTASIIASVLFSAVSALFTLYLMRQGRLVVGPGGGSLWSDLRSVPGLLGGFLLAAPRAAWKLVRG